MEWPKEVRKGGAVVKIYREASEHTASGYAYVLTWYVGKLRRRQKFASEEAALKEASLKANQVRTGEIQASGMTSEDRRELQAARELAGDFGVLPALREWKANRDRILNATHKATVTGCIQEFYRQKRALGVKVEAGYEKTFPRFKERFGERVLASLSLPELEAYLAQFTNLASRNSHRQRIVTLFRWARKRGMLPLDTMTAAERTEAARIPNERIGLVTPDELKQTYEVIKEHPSLFPALVLAAACGLRRAEVHAQTWEDIELERGFLRVTAAKPNTPAWRMVRIPKPALEALKGISGKGRITEVLAMDMIRLYCRQKKLTLADNGFRHSWISARVAITGNVPETSLEAGNTPKVLYRHYRELMRKEDAEAWFALPGAGQSPAAGA